MGNLNQAVHLNFSDIVLIIHNLHDAQFEVLEFAEEDFIQSRNIALQTTLTRTIFIIKCFYTRMKRQLMMFTREIATRTPSFSYFLEICNW
jgi:hypothetical protein